MAVDRAVAEFLVRNSAKTATELWAKFCLAAIDKGVEPEVLLEKMLVEKMEEYVAFSGK